MNNPFDRAMVRNLYDYTGNYAVQNSLSFSCIYCAGIAVSSSNKEVHKILPFWNFTILLQSAGGLHSVFS